ncbi:hypothetical protein C4D60_Mb01t27620 [Musa balbisiana]|uniref:Uncharacterized protein n=1 Tax=Musa balbisiana TaxID=52838 RepID=A0A4S8JR66_MUSBA|nr:hypothetical protein C4D60_Mb01t27620 [Musa balbisiana]
MRRTEKQLRPSFSKSTENRASVTFCVGVPFLIGPYSPAHRQAATTTISSAAATSAPYTAITSLRGGSDGFARAVKIDGCYSPQGPSHYGIPLVLFVFPHDTVAAADPLRHQPGPLAFRDQGFEDDN